MFDNDLEKCRQAVMDVCYCMAATLTADNVYHKKRIPFYECQTEQPFY